MRALVVVIILLSITTSSPAEDFGAGENLYIKTYKCQFCHAIGEAAANRPGAIGPSLNGLVGRKAGSVAGYSYSEANRTSQIVWTYESFREYIHDPRAAMPGTKMVFVGVKDEKEIRDLWAYLTNFDATGNRKIAAGPKPLPESEIPISADRLPRGFGVGEVLDVLGISVGDSREAAVEKLRSQFGDAGLRHHELPASIVVGSDPLLAKRYPNHLGTGLRYNYHGFTSVEVVAKDESTETLTLNFSTPAFGAKVERIVRDVYYVDAQQSRRGPSLPETVAAIKSKYGEPSFENREFDTTELSYIWHNNARVRPPEMEQFKSSKQACASWTAGRSTRSNYKNYEEYRSDRRDDFVGCTGGIVFLVQAEPAYRDVLKRLTVIAADYRRMRDNLLRTDAFLLNALDQKIKNTPAPTGRPRL